MAIDIRALAGQAMANAQSMVTIAGKATSAVSKASKASSAAPPRAAGEGGMGFTGTLHGNGPSTSVPTVTPSAGKGVVATGAVSTTPASSSPSVTTGPGSAVPATSLDDWDSTPLNSPSSTSIPPWMLLLGGIIAVYLLVKRG